MWPFWRRRAVLAETPKRQDRPLPLSELLPYPVRLRPPAELRETACRVGDRIERRLALHAPALDRPVAFVGGVWLAPLLYSLEASSSLAEARRMWEQSVPPQRATEILTWLIGCRALEPFTVRPPGS